MRKLLTLVLFAVLTMAVACSSGPEVRSDVDSTVDASKFKTFSFQPEFGMEGEGFSPELGPLVREGTRSRLEKLGYTYVEIDQNPDLVFDFHLSAETVREERVKSTAKPTSTGVGGAIHDYNVPSGEFQNRKEIIEYEKGTLRADAINVGDNKLFWECIVIGKLNRPENSEKRKEAVEGVLDIVFEEWKFKPAS